MNPPDDASALPVLTVSELNRMARRALESQLPLLWVEGEVSNFTRAASGHWYFSLKDADAQVRCVMFRGRNQFAEFTPANGDHVEIRALPSLYEARGEFQLGADTIRRAGAGKLYEAFLKLKARLESEGLFDPARKRPLPGLPRSLGIVTSLQAAALQDVLSAIARRMPGQRVVIYPAPVQGTGAGAQLAAAIDSASTRAECDVLLVCRGGGSLEDLWAFNEEAVVRAIARCTLPVVSGIGHETDFTLADFAADLRAPTPTAAAELATPLRSELLAQLDTQAHQLRRHFVRKQHDVAQQLDFLARRLLHPAEHLQRQHAQLAQWAWRMTQSLRLRILHARTRIELLAPRIVNPVQTLQRQRLHLQNRHNQLQRALASSLNQHQLTLARLTASLSHLDPDQVLARGYSLVQREDGSVVQEAGLLHQGETLQVRFRKGRAEATVSSVLPE